MILISVGHNVLGSRLALQSMLYFYCRNNILFTELVQGFDWCWLSSRSEGLYNTIDELRLQQPIPGHSPGPIPYSTFRSSVTSGSSEFSNPHELSGKTWEAIVLVHMLVQSCGQCVVKPPELLLHKVLMRKRTGVWVFFFHWPKVWKWSSIHWIA